KLRNALIALGLDPRTDRQAGTLNALGFDLQHSTADNLLNAHRGYQVAFHAEQAGRIVPGTYNYYAVSADGRHYLPITEKVVLASRLQLGNIRPVGLDEVNVPFSKKYFLGGATSIRGWGRYEVSPLSGSGLPLGGDSMLAFSEEMRAVISGNFGGVLFLDGGNVWAESMGFTLSGLRYSIGPGLRYQTPVGPIRFDFGYQLNPIPGLFVNGQPQSRRWRIHFSIGQAFYLRAEQDLGRTTMRIARRLLHALVVVLTLLVGATAAAVVVMQTAWFKNWLRGYIVREAGQYLNGQLSIQRLGGNLFFGIEMENIGLSMDGSQVVAVKDLGLDYNVFELISKGL